MYLTKIGKNVSETDPHVEFEKLADDLVMVSVNNDPNDRSRIFSYWRLSGDGSNPPLEIGVNSQTGTIKSITIFIDANCFREISFPDSHISYGNMRVDRSIFKKANDYVDAEGHYYAALAGNKFMCSFHGQCDIREIIVNQKIQFYLDDQDQLRGIAVNNLTDTEVNMIKALI